jgi:hypothetical protein
MTTATLRENFVGLLPAGFGMSVLWNWDEWAFGWCGEFVSLGSAGLVLGPVQVQIEWSIL